MQLSPLLWVVLNKEEKNNGWNTVMVYRYFKMLISCLSMILLLNVMAFAGSNPPAPIDVTKGILLGQFKINGKTPLANGRLFVYNDAMGPSSPNEIVRVPDYMANLDENGKFSLDLPAGIYYLSASKTPDGGSMRPPAEGEPVYFKMDSKGKDHAFIVSVGRKTNAGVISSSAPMKRNYKGATMIEGIVTDATGAPVEGAVIYAYVDPDIQDKARFVSERTAKDGKFVLNVNDTGSYYLRVRGEYGGGAPKEGEIVNINNPKEQIAVTLKKGEKLTGVTIQVKRQQRGPLYNGN